VRQVLINVGEQTQQDGEQKREYEDRLLAPEELVDVSDDHAEHDGRQRSVHLEFACELAHAFDVV